jgi:hypothetical protein
MNLSKTAVALYVLLVFASGVLVGGLGYRLYTVSPVSASGARNSDEYRRKYLDEMRSRLHITAEQESQLTAILDETRARYREAQDRMKPEMQQIRKEQTDKVIAILSPAQQQEYARMREERDRRRREQDPSQKR